jgi:hypothetical protein
MLTEQQLTAAIGSTAYDPDGEKIGTVEHFFVDDRTGAPTWVAIATGLFGGRHSVVPALEATFADGGLRLPVTRDAVKSAPEIGGDHLDPAEESALRRHYGLDGASAETPTWTPTSGGVAPLGATDEGDPTPDPARPAGTPAWTPTAEGVVPVGATDEDEPAPPIETPAWTPTTEGVVPVGATDATDPVPTPTRPLLVKYLVTEEVQVTVPIRREEVRVEQVPIDAPDDGAGEWLVSGPRHAAEPSGPPGEVVLHTERPVVSVEVVPIERVRLRSDPTEGQEQVVRDRIPVEEPPGGVSPR